MFLFFIIQPPPVHPTAEVISRPSSLEKEETLLQNNQPFSQTAHIIQQLPSISPTNTMSPVDPSLAPGQKPTKRRKKEKDESKTQKKRKKRKEGL